MIFHKTGRLAIKGLLGASFLILSACLGEPIADIKDGPMADINRQSLLGGKVDLCTDSRIAVKPDVVLGYLDLAKLDEDSLSAVRQWVESQDMQLKPWDKGQSSWVPSGTRPAESLCEHAIKKQGNLYRAVFPDRLEHGEPAQKIRLAEAGIMPLVATYNFWFQDDRLVLIEAMGEQMTTPLYIYNPTSSKQ